MTKPIQPESVEVTQADRDALTAIWLLSFRQAGKERDDTPFLEILARHRIASTTPTDEAVEASDLAKELLAQSFERSGEQKCAEAVRRGKVAGFGTPLWMDEALFAIRTALHTALSTPTDATAVEAEREAHDDFTRGYLIAVANIMHTHGEDVIAQDVLSQLGAGEGAIKRLGLCEYDAPVLRKLFREINRKHRNDEQRRARTPREG
jgi:hypothetical protein